MLRHLESAAGTRLGPLLLQTVHFVGQPAVHTWVLITSIATSAVENTTGAVAVLETRSLSGIICIQGSGGRMFHRGESKDRGRGPP